MAARWGMGKALCASVGVVSGVGAQIQMNVSWLICGRRIGSWGWGLEKSWEKAPKSYRLLAYMWSNEKALHYLFLGRWRWPRSGR